MYSTLEYFKSPCYNIHRSVYVISDTEMKKLELQDHQVELDSILDHRKRLDDAYERQSKWLEEREFSVIK